MEAQELGYLYEVKLGVLIEVMAPPEHPQLNELLLENIGDYLIQCFPEGVGAEHLIEDVRLVRVMDLATGEHEWKEGQDGETTGTTAPPAGAD